MPVPAVTSPRDSRLRLQVRELATTTTLVEVAGEIDLTTGSDLASCLEDRLDDVDRDLVVDLSAVTFLAAAGLTVLVRTDQRVRAAGRHLRLIVGPSCVDRVLQITGLDRQLDCSRRREQP